jgi:Mechanosensitive ion channel, conserved TM helix
MVIASIGDQVTKAFAVFFIWLPHLIGALVALVIGYFVAKLVGRLVGRVLHRAGLDRVVHSNTGGGFVRRVVPQPSKLLGTIVFWAIFLSAVSLAVSVLGVDALQNFVASVWAYLPNVLAALAIFLVAGALAAGVAGLVGRVMGDTPLGKIVATAAPVLIMTIATFMILDQLKIAHNIVVITYAGLLGAIALGTALAFGLGGREVAAQMLQGAYEKGRENVDQAKDDLATGRERAKSELQDMKDSDSPIARDSGTTQPQTAAPTNRQ